MKGLSQDATCPGYCCAAFYWPWTLTEQRARAKAGKGYDSEQIAEMLIPLTPKEARERFEHFGGDVEAAHPDSFAWEHRGHHFTCKNWDEETRLCKIYEDRPTMCRDYPYGRECSPGCGVKCGLSTTERANIREEQIGNQWKAYVAPKPQREKLA